jgi:lipopolysaccharide transport system permease protein
VDAPDSLPQVVYTADTQLRRPRQFIGRMMADLLASRELAWRLFARNIRARYRQSLLGYLWVILPPLATTLVWVYLNASHILQVKETDVPYPAYVLVGTLLWQGFVDALNSPLSQHLASQSMLSKINLPWEALVMAGLGEVLFNSAIRLVLLLGVFVWFRIAVPPTIFLAPLGLLALLALGATLGLWLVPPGMLYPDIRRGLVILTTFWFFLTPVVYPPPPTWPAALLVKLNPVSPLLITTRELLTTGTLSQAGNAFLVAGLTFVLLVIGWVLYRLSVPHLVERMTAR